MSIEVVSFDAAGTLFTVRERVGVTYARLGRRHGLHPDPRRLEAGFTTAFAAAMPLAFPGITDEDLGRYERAWWQRVASHAFAAAGIAHLPPGLFDELFAHYATAAAWRCYDETRSVLSDLRARGRRLCVVSNFDSRLLPLMAELGLAELVDSITASSLARAAKPDTAIFRTALATLGTSPQTAVHVGDDVVADVHGARSAGLRAVLMQRSAVPSGPVPRGVPVVRSLRDLRRVLGD